MTLVPLDGEILSDARGLGFDTGGDLLVASPGKIYRLDPWTGEHQVVLYYSTTVVRDVVGVEGEIIFLDSSRNIRRVDLSGGTPTTSFIHIVQLFTTQPQRLVVVPEPGTTIGLILGSLGLAFLSHLRARSPSPSPRPQF